MHIGKGTTMWRTGLAVLMLGLAVGLAGCAAGSKVVMRVNCGDERPYTDKAGNLWSPDQEFSPGAKYGAVGGATVEREPLKDVEATAMPRVYLTERYVMDNYTFALPNGTYTVRLHFCETYEGIFAVGERVFSVKVQGKEVLKNFDVFKEGGGFGKPVVKTISGAAVTDGKLVIDFVSDVQNPEINGIEILQ